MVVLCNIICIICLNFECNQTIYIFFMWSMFYWIIHTHWTFLFINQYHHKITFSCFLPLGYRFSRHWKQSSLIASTEEREAYEDSMNDEQVFQDIVEMLFAGNITIYGAKFDHSNGSNKVEKTIRIQEHEKYIKYHQHAL